ncbi:hypothetical protein [Candidatus Midichloria mitochondrii]|nr:hypothetical protein [Candidatus Midichloria mitochondrii]MDJ1256566.1 hypothetical protein [Candidatus Midichloria mitochondrii]MDJ1299139.1 hypothetical protein [Candidatus Midichloria mitochondrii]
MTIKCKYCGSTAEQVKNGVVYGPARGKIIGARIAKRITEKVISGRNTL